MNTQVETVDSSSVVSNIINISNTINPLLASTFATASTTGAPNEITVTSTEGFIEDQTVQFKVSTGTSFDANIATDGTVYFVDTIVNGTTFTIKDENDVQIVTAGGTGNMLVEVGGTPAVRVTASHSFTENDLVRIDGTLGSIQLNNNTFYVKIIDSNQFDLYSMPYDPTVGATNFPITTISTYEGSGYVWLAGSFIIVNQIATTSTAAALVNAGSFVLDETYTIVSLGDTDFTLIGAASNAVGVSFVATGVGAGTGTASIPNYITVTSTNQFVINTPVIFTGTTFGNIVAGTTYYIRDIISNTKFTISATRDGSEFVLTNDSGSMNVTQWEQDSTERLWVTINGYRVPSSKMKLNENNELSILNELIIGDEVIITSMIPSATPDRETYFNFVDSEGNASVYRANTGTKTWLIQPIYDLSSEIFVDDVTKLTNVIVQTENVPAVGTDGKYEIGLNADKRIITNVTIFNETTQQLIASDDYQVIVEELSPLVKIEPGVYINENDVLTVTILEGNLIYVNGEQIRFGTVDFDNNSLGSLTRGVNGTAKQNTIDKYTEVYGLLSKNRLSNVLYNLHWNSEVFNATLGDPLQISNTVAAEFLNSDII